MEREAFLARVREGMSTSRLPPHPDADPGLLVPDLGVADLAAMFAERLEEIDGSFHRALSDPDARTIVTGIARTHGAHSFMAWDDVHLPVPGVTAALEEAGLRRVSGVLPEGGRLDHQMGYVDVALGVTGAEAGLAESGSVIVRSGEGRPRMASVIPEVHVALLSAERLHRSLSHWAAESAAGIAGAANVVVISGPSRTGDIEQNLNLGVHGPRHVHVILVG